MLLSFRFRALDGFIPFVVAAIVFAAFPPAIRAEHRYIYVNNNESPSSSVSSLWEEVSSGTLLSVIGSPFATGGSGDFTPNAGGVQVLAVENHLYATNPLSNNIAAFEIGSDGSLTDIPGTPFPTLGNRPNGIAIDSGNSLMFVANSLSNTVAVFNVASNGALSLVSGAPFAVASLPLDLAIDTANSLLFVSHLNVGVGVYTIGGGGSSLTAIAGSPFDAGGGKHGLAINAAGTRLYVANHSAETVSGFDIGGGGTLSAVTGSPFTVGSGAGEGPTEVLFHPSLDILYVSTDTTNNVYAYDIDTGTGELTELGSSPFATGGDGSSGIAIDDVNARLFVVNGGTSLTPSRDVSVFDIAGDGSLSAVAGSPFATGASGGTPASITLAVVDDFDCTAAAPGVCIPARGRTDRECYAEWYVDADPPPSINPFTNTPHQRVWCQNGNPGCDFDNDGTDDHCTFHVRVCINNQDPRFASCTPVDIGEYSLLRPRPGSSLNDAFDDDNVEAFQKAMSGDTCNNDPSRSCLVNGDCLSGGTCTEPAVIGVPFVSGTTTLIPGSTNATLDHCSNVMELKVRLRPAAGGGGYRTRSRSFRHRARTGAGLTDFDGLRLTCTPAS